MGTVMSQREGSKGPACSWRQKRFSGVVRTPVSRPARFRLHSPPTILPGCCWASVSAYGCLPGPNRALLEGVGQPALALLEVGAASAG
jgi:hypothetical protein